MVKRSKYLAVIHPGGICLSLVFPEPNQMATLNNRQIVTYSTVFGEEPGDVMELLRGIDKSVVIKLIARLNFVFRSKQIATVPDVLGMWFGSSNYAFRNKAMYLINRGYSSLNVPMHKLTILSMWTNLTILDLLIAELETDQPKKSDDESERDFFKAYLIVNESFGKGSNAMVPTIEGYKDNRAGWYARNMITTQIKYHDTANVSAKEFFYPQIIRAYHCFKFLEQRGHQQLIDLFLETYGVTCWQEYFALIIPIATVGYKKGDGSGLYYFKITNTPEQEQRNRFIRKLSLTGLKIYPEMPDFLYARALPLYETEPNHFLVCDTVLALQRIHSSMYFELKEINDESPELNIRAKNFSSFYTTEFVEHYLAYAVLNDIFADSGFYHISGENIKKQFHISQEPDYYVRNGNKVFMLEVKGSILAGNIKQSFDYAVIDAELKKKFYRKSDGKKNTNIGITQLVDRISLLLGEENKVIYDEVDDHRKLEVYPILITTERSLSAPGMNHLFNEWFEEALNEETALANRHYQVKPFTILDMDTLINFSAMYKNNKKFMEDSVRAYHQFIKIKTPVKENSSTPQQAEANMNHTMKSYSDFLQSNYNPDGPELYMQIAKEIVAYTDALKNK